MLAGIISVCYKNGTMQAKLVGKITARHGKLVEKITTNILKVVGKSVSLFPDKVSDYAEKEN